MDHLCQCVIPKWKQTRTTLVVVLLSLKEQKRVQEGRYPTLNDEGIATAKGNIAIATKVAGIMRRC